jgi:putative CocE/NonD family hydrolase
MGGGDGSKTKDGHMMHGGEWKYAKEWPLPETVFTKYYMHGDGGLITEPPTEESSSTTYQSDPDNPVPTIGSTNSSGILRGKEGLTTSRGAQNQVEMENIVGCKPPYLPLWTRPDVLVFSTPPLQEEVEVTGPITVKLLASSSCVDTDFTNRLIDIYPPSMDYPLGYHMNLTAGGGIIRARYRDSLEKEELMEPGEIYEFTINPKPTSNLFAVGHRICIYIASSCYPEFDVNPNTGEPVGRHRMKKVAENTIYHDAEHPSHVVLPIIPLKRAQ